LFILGIYSFRYLRWVRIGSSTDYNSEYRFYEKPLRIAMKNTICVIVVLLACILLAGCGGANTDDAGEAVKTYFQAIVAQDADGAAAVSCPDWQETARGEVASFAGVKARLDNLSCKAASSKDGEALVECSGAIVATYVDQEMRFDLSERSYRVVQQNEKWLVCGYGQ
jgi:predicted small secreted protein